ncbi:MAG: HEAT repeat domain-containing protein [Candidatus Wallbacteria bacterium]|nr:HEAT repeat domain-containing protein [Candidatus Wallbacteria bacterium]
MNLDKLLVELSTAQDDEIHSIKKDILTDLSVENAHKLLAASLSADKNLKMKLLRIVMEIRNLPIQNTLVEVFGKEKDPDAKLLLTVALGRCGNRKIISSLIELIRSENYLMRLKAVLALQLIGSPALKELLMIMFKCLETDHVFAELIAEIIVQIPGKTLADLDKITTIKNPLIARIIGSVDDPESVQFLVGFLDAKNHALSRAVRDALISLGPKYADLLGDFITLGNHEYNYWLPQVLVKFLETGKTILLSKLKQAPPDLLCNILDVLEYKPEQEIKDLYLQSLTKGNLKLKEIASRKILDSNDSSLIFEAKRLLFSPIDSNTKYFALFIANKAEIADDVIAEHLRGSTADKLMATIIKTSQPKKENFTLYIDMLKDEDPFVKQSAFNILCKMTREFFDQIMEASLSGNPEIRKNCLALISRMGKESVRIISHKLELGNQTEKFQAAYLVGQLYLYDLKDKLENLSNDGNDWVRKFSRLSLAKLAGPDEIGKLIKSQNQDSNEAGISLLQEDPDLYAPILFKCWNDVRDPLRERVKKILIDQGKKRPEILNKFLESTRVESAVTFLKTIQKQLDLNKSFK